MITGLLTKDSPLRRVFPDGMIPLTSPHAIGVRLGGSAVPEHCYMLSVAEVLRDPVKFAAVVALMAETNGCTADEVRAFFAKSEVVPIRAANITGVTMPLRNFL